MRLIDADAFNDWILSHFAEPQSALILTLQGFIAEQPTAYCIDKVVKEFDKKYNNSLWIKGDDEFSITRNELIEIVKQGGVSESEQKLKEMESD